MITEHCQIELMLPDAGRWRGKVLAKSALLPALTPPPQMLDAASLVLRDVEHVLFSWGTCARSAVAGRRASFSLLFLPGRLVWSVVVGVPDAGVAACSWVPVVASPVCTGIAVCLLG